MFKKITFFTCFFLVNITFSQTVSTITAGNFYDSIAMDSQGNIYCSDFFGGSVFKYDTNGNVTTFQSGFTNPNGIDVNSQDEIFICAAGANTVFKYDTNGTLLNSYTSGVNNPTGIKNIPGTTNMLIVEYNNNTLKRLASDGTVTTLFSGFPLNGPSGIAFLNGETYISNYNDRKIMRFENGALTLVTQLPATAVNNNVLGFITASNNQLYATQIGAHQIYAIEPISGTATVYAGSVSGNTDGDISTATFNFPNGILADPVNDRVFISDAGTSNLRIISNAQLSVDEFIEQDAQFIVTQDAQTDSLQVSALLNSNKKVSIQLFEITGKEVFNKEYTVTNLAFSASIQKSTFTSGIYIILCTQEDKIIRKKISF